MREIFILLPILAFICQSCAPSLSDLESLLTHQPVVVAVAPSDGLILNKVASVKVIFSTPITPQSIEPDSFAVAPLEGETAELKDIAVDVSDGKISTVAGSYSVSEDARIAEFVPDEAFRDGESYLIIVTTKIRTPSGVPLNQTPGNSPMPFISTFSISASQNADDELNFNNTDGEGVERGEEGGQIEQAEREDVPVRPDVIVINEILYDALTNDTDGNEFIELFGTAGGDISGYSLVFINGADGEVVESIDIPDGAIIPDDGIYLIADTRTNSPDETNIPNADFLDNFDPQNGPECVQLLDNHGAELDAVGYGSPLPQTAQNKLACFEGSPAPDAPAGKSISRTGASDTNNNSADFVILDSPTPGTF